jgi:hypothetical protein
MAWGFCLVAVVVCKKTYFLERILMENRNWSSKMKVASGKRFGLGHVGELKVRNFNHCVFFLHLKFEVLCLRVFGLR